MNSRNIFSVYDILNLSTLAVEDAKEIALQKIVEAKTYTSLHSFVQTAVIENIIKKAESTTELVNRISDFVLVH